MLLFEDLIAWSKEETEVNVLKFSDFLDFIIFLISWNTSISDISNWEWLLVIDIIFMK